jgi:hypothetical protein
MEKCGTEEQHSEDHGGRETRVVAIEDEFNGFGACGAVGHRGGAFGGLFSGLCWS